MANAGQSIAHVPSTGAESHLKESYLQLLKLCITGLAGPEPYSAVLKRRGRVKLERLPDSQLHKRLEGRDWPANGLTMIGMKRLDNLQSCVEDVLRNDVPGDLIEAGVWRGGAAMLMRALLKVHSVSDRTVFAADSFAGLPAPDEARFPADMGDAFHKVDFLSVPLDAVKGNFDRYGLLDDQVRFVKGWFRDTLPTLTDRTWAVVRLDGDLYESTIVALESLYPGLSVGGYLIVDDYGAVPGCRQAVHDYRESHGIDEPMKRVDWTGIYWRKQSSVPLDSASSER